MSVFSSLILSLPNFIVSVYSSTLPRSHCVTSHSLQNRLDCKVWNGFGSGQKLGKYDKWRKSKKTQFSEQIKGTSCYWQVNVVPGKLICSCKNKIQYIWNERRRTLALESELMFQANISGPVTHEPKYLT